MDTVSIIGLSLIAVFIIGVILAIFKSNHNDVPETSNQYSKKKKSQSFGWYDEVSTEVLNIIGRNPNNVDNIDTLTLNTVIIVETPRRDEDMKVLCANNVSCADALFFAAFLIRAFCICNNPKIQNAIEFSDRYIKNILAVANHKYKIDSITLSRMFDNRMQFYDSIFTSKDKMEEKIAALGTEFEFIIVQDYMGEYKPFAADSPLTIIGIENQYAQFEAAAYLKYIFKCINSFS